MRGAVVFPDPHTVAKPPIGNPVPGTEPVPPAPAAGSALPAEREAKRPLPELKGRRARKPAPVKSGGDDPLEMVKSLLWAVLLFFVIRMFLVTAYSIPSESMEDTLLIGDYLMANNALFGATVPFTDIRLPSLRNPRRGEIVVFRPTYNNPRIDVVKRVVGVPGDTLQMRDKVLYLNGKAVKEPFTKYVDGYDDPITEYGQGMMDPTVDQARYGSHNHIPLLPAGVDKRTYQPTRNNWGPLVIPPAHYWLMGDNRDRSLDSRFMGPIPREVIRGKPLFIYFSYDKTNESAAFPRPLTAARWDRIFNRVK